jgi:uncharacterized protein YraI
VIPDPGPVSGEPVSVRRSSPLDLANGSHDTLLGPALEGRGLVALPGRERLRESLVMMRYVYLGLVLLLPTQSPAQVMVTQQFPMTQAFTTQNVNLRAGPDRGFPLVSWLPGGTPVNVFGCLNGWRWCDVGVGFNRGWVYGRFLSMPFGGQQVLIMNSGPRIGVPVVTFSVGSYWGAHYRNRPWFHQPPPPGFGPPPGRPPPPSRPPPPPPRPPAARPPAAAPPSARPPSGGQPPPGARPPPGPGQR